MKKVFIRSIKAFIQSEEGIYTKRRRHLYKAKKAFRFIEEDIKLRPSRAGPEISPKVAGPEISPKVAGPEISPKVAGPEISPKVAGFEISPKLAGPKISPKVAGPEISPLVASNSSLVRQVVAVLQAVENSVNDKEAVNSTFLEKRKRSGKKGVDYYLPVKSGTITCQEPSPAR
jgi:hypothetical protein